MPDHDLYELTNVALQSGVTLPRVELAYRTYGELNAARDNVILMPTYYGAQHADTTARSAPRGVFAQEVDGLSSRDGPRGYDAEDHTSQRHNSKGHEQHDRMETGVRHSRQPISSKRNQRAYA